MYLPTSTVGGLCFHAQADPGPHLSPPSLIILVGHFFNSLPLMHSTANCLHKPDHFHGIPGAIDCSAMASGQLHFHSVANMMNTRVCEANRHVNLAAVTDSNYLSLSNSRVAFTRNFLLRKLRGPYVKWQAKQSSVLKQQRNVSMKRLLMCSPYLLRDTGMLLILALMVTGRHALQIHHCPEVLKLTQVHTVGKKLMWTLRIFLQPPCNAEMTFDLFRQKIQELKLMPRRKVVTF